MSKQTLGDIQKMYLDPKHAPQGNPRMRLATWLERQGLPAAGKLLRMVERDIAQEEPK